MVRVEAIRRSRGTQAGRSRRGSSAHRARSCFSSWQEDEDSAAPGGLGWLRPVGCYGGGLGQVSGPPGRFGVR